MRPGLKTLGGANGANSPAADQTGGSSLGLNLMAEPPNIQYGSPFSTMIKKRPSLGEIKEEVRNCEERSEERSDEIAKAS